MSKCHGAGFIRRKLGNPLFYHSLGVARMAYRLALAYGVDENVAFFAGLWHDYGKAISSTELLKKAQEMHLALDDITVRSPQLMHAPVGAALVGRETGMDDRRFLRAIEFHTTGDAGLSLLEKIVYLADAIELGRTYPGVQKLRRMAFSDIDNTLLIVIDNTIKRVIQKGNLLHPRTVAFRNELIAGDRIQKTEFRIQNKEL